MEFFPIILMAIAGSCLSFFCGFGLGTLLLPAFMLFFPPPIAVAGTAVVHMANNVFKLFLVGKQADWSIIRTFGLLSVVGALIGALSLQWVSKLGSIYEYTLSGELHEITFIRVIIALVIIGFSFLEILPKFQSIKLPRKVLPVGGLISGFFGGLSGHQGALRSAFLMKAGLDKSAFIGTRVVCACLVDVTRISVYASQIGSHWRDIDIRLLAAASLAAFTGAWLGNKWMKKTELKVMNLIISISLVLFGIAFGLDLI
jgi:uncharacterized protein